MSKRAALRIVIAGGALAALLCVLAAPAFASGSGYAPSGPPTAASSAGFSSIVVAETIDNSGGTVTGSSNGGTCTVNVPSGAFPDGGEVVISAGAPSSIDAGSGKTVVIDFSVSVLDPNTGNPLTGTFSPPITVTISYSGITSSDTVVEVTSPGVVTLVTGAQVTQGQALVTVSSDPNLAVVTTASSTSPPTASAGSLAFTGIGPAVDVMALIGVLSIALGFLLLLLWRIRTG